MSTQKVTISLVNSFANVPVKKVLGLKKTYNISFPGPANRNSEPVKDQSMKKFSILVSPATQATFINSVLSWYDSINGYDDSFKMKNYARDYLLARNKRVKTVIVSIEGAINRKYKFNNVFPCSWMIENLNTDNENLVKIEFCYDQNTVVPGISKGLEKEGGMITPAKESLIPKVKAPSSEGVNGSDQGVTNLIN